MGYFHYFNYSYLLFILPALFVTIFAQYKVKSTFKKYSAVHSMRGLTGMQAARLILDQNGLNDVKVEGIRGQLSDHYDPGSNVIRLSPDVYGNTSTAAIGVAAHEAGHAIQYAVGYGPIKIRAAIIPVTNIGSNMGIILFMIGIFLQMTALTFVGIALFSLTLVFQLITLPVEFNASRRAIEILDTSGMLSPQELSGAKKVLSAAAMTYVAGMLMALSQLLYYISIANRGRRR